MHEKFTKPYDPKKTEERIYTLWEESGLFNPDVCVEKGVTAPDAQSFSAVLPPPNVTGVLHLGHAYENALQDAVIRFRRMTGKRTVWIPGTDSAAIATEARVLKEIQKKNRNDIGRELLVRRIETFAKESESTILGQIRRMGASLDWSRYAYTLDKKRSHAVTEAFKRMYNAGLIYRGERIVNWDPKGQTTISDDEIVYQEEKAKFYYFKYGPFEIGTARPETKFGDKYVVMHPNDSRYKVYKHGDTVSIEWISGPITATIIKDEAVDMDFGTGVMTITPAHSAVDFEIAERHNLDKEQIIDKHGKLLRIAGEFAGMKITEARENIVEKMRKKGLLITIDENYVHNIATAERTGAIIEPQIMEQWFVGVEKPFTIPHSEIPGIQSGSETTLKEIMRKAVESGAISMPQEGFRKAYFHWIDNLHDWCISRQIWFGHRIPVWYHEGVCIPISGRESEVSECIETVVGEMEPKCEHCQAKYTQDPDVLDTWFSSALWTFSTLGWPEKTKDLETYHPTSFISPAYEILNLWISRMILMSGFHLSQVPFKTVLLHGLVRDKEGRKFSKSLDNGIDPLLMIDRYSADALRMGLLAGTAIGNDIRFDESKVKGYKHFANKLWNVTRFVLDTTKDYDLSKKPELFHDDELLLDPMKDYIAQVTKDLENYNLHLAAERIYGYVWNTFADKILEESKPILNGPDESAKISRGWTLYAILVINLKLLHPFMPFVTEEIWQELPKKDSEMLMVAKWPPVFE